MSKIQNNPAIVLFGARNDGKFKVSEDVAALGLDLLRVSPSELSLVSIPDLPQVRYGDYLRALPTFMRAVKSGKKQSSANPFFSVNYVSLSQAERSRFMIPIIPPPVVLAWSPEAPEETLAQIREKIVVQEIVSGGKPALEFKPGCWEDIEKVKGYKINPVATAPNKFVNLKAFGLFRDLWTLISILIHTHRYPAFVDKEQQQEIKNWHVGRSAGTKMLNDLDEDMDEHPAMSDTGMEDGDAPYGDSPVTHKGLSMMIDMSGTPTQVPHVIDLAKIDEVKTPQGLWFPYFRQLAHEDTETVPAFCERYLYHGLGDDTEECVSGLRYLKGEWGMIGKSDSGRVATHIVKTMELALQAQAHLVIVMRGTTYLGALMRGSGYTIDANRAAYRPVEWAQLRAAIISSDMHNIAMSAISKLLGNTEQQAAFLKSKSMMDVRKILVESWTIEKNKADITRHVAYLDFNQPSWIVNEIMVDHAFKLIHDPNMSVSLLPNSLPIHSSMVFSTDVLSLVWSCFGGQAPSFRIPGGHPFHLGSDMEIDHKLKDGSLSKRKIVRIAVRNVSLERAIEDLKVVRADKTILNPLVLPRVKTSQKYQDKVFTEDRGKALLASLRIFCDIAAKGSVSKGKRRAGDDGDEPARKKAKLGADDWD